MAAVFENQHLHYETQGILAVDRKSLLSVKSQKKDTKGRRSGLSWPVRWEKASQIPYSFLTSPRSGFIPLDVRTLLGVFRTLLENGATVIVIEHDLDVIRSADYIVDMGPGGGNEGGRIVAAGTPEEIRRTPESRTGKYL